MGNIYVGSFKDILRNYYDKQQKLNKEIEANNQKYTPEYAEQANAEVKAKQAAVYNGARQSITNVFEQVKGYLASANFINVEALTSDRLLFTDNSGFELTPEDVRGYVERYQGNPTMLRLIKDWIAKHNTPEDGQMFGKFHDVKITLPSDQVSVYKQFADSALRICDKIFTTGSSQTEIDYYGDEHMAKELYDTIGNGMDLSNYKGHRVPESVKHSFDAVKLNIETGNGNVFVQ